MCVGLVAVLVFAEPDAGSPKFHEYDRPMPLDVFEKLTGMLAQTLLLFTLKLAIGSGSAVTWITSVAIQPVASSMVNVYVWLLTAVTTGFGQLAQLRLVLGVQEYVIVPVPVPAATAPIVAVDPTQMEVSGPAFALQG